VHSYNTEPDAVFAYRLHVIRPKAAGSVESELFSDTAAFFTGESEDDEDEGQEMELAQVTRESLRGVKGVQSAIEEYLVDDETLIIFPSQKPSNA
jgi:hypothetical protein